MSSPRRVRPLPRGWQRTRARVLRRDGGVCYVCGQPGADEVDHVVPAADGGGDELENLAAIHSRPCHAEKTAREALAHNKTAIPRRRPAEKHPGEL